MGYQIKAMGTAYLFLFYKIKNKILYYNYFYFMLKLEQFNNNFKLEKIPELKKEVKLFFTEDPSIKFINRIKEEYVKKVNLLGQKIALLVYNEKVKD